MVVLTAWFFICALYFRRNKWLNIKKMPKEEKRSIFEQILLHYLPKMTRFAVSHYRFKTPHHTQEGHQGCLCFRTPLGYDKKVEQLS